MKAPELSQAENPEVLSSAVFASDFGRSVATYSYLHYPLPLFSEKGKSPFPQYHLTLGNQAPAGVNKHSQLGSPGRGRGIQCQATESETAPLRLLGDLGPTPVTSLVVG